MCTVFLDEPTHVRVRVSLACCGNGSMAYSERRPGAGVQEVEDTSRECSVELDGDGSSRELRMRIESTILD